ncbi:MAG: GAF domain-containing sensor histidine kinase [Halolamina sp.]
MLSVPVGDGVVFQALSSEAGAFDETDLEHAELLAASAGAALSRIRSEQALREPRQPSEGLHDAATDIAAAEEVLAFHQCSIGLREGETLVPAIQSSDTSPDGTRAMHGSERLKRKTARTGESFRVDEIADGNGTEPTRPEYRSGISIPIGDLGVFQAIATEPNAFDAGDVSLAELLMAHVAVSLERVRAKADLRAQRDRLERGERIQAEVERQTVDGRRQFLLQVIPLEIGEENSRGYAIYTDVTDQREREAALRRQNERLAQFASVVSHDLRNPLNVASGYLELAREGRDVGETEPIALDQTARAARSHVASEGVRLAVETDRRIEADQDRLIELLENLYRNTVEHRRENTPAGGGTDVNDALTVTVSDLCEGAEWRGFVVADNGVGIDPSIDPFETGTTTSEEGTGFGLAIVEGIAEAHGWSVTAAESDDGGARFEFRVE